nr:tripartite tricarboxylate transporter permease [Paenibacillus mucilaginosus]
MGGTISILGLMLIGPPLAEWALHFGPPEFFALMVLGLSTVIGLMGKSVVRGLVSAFLGLNLAMIGIDPMSGTVRFTMDTPQLMNGIDFVIVAMGLFGLSEILLGMEKMSSAGKPPKLQGMLPRREEWKPNMKAIGRGTVLGFVIGLIPGTNSVIPALLSYSLEKRLAKDPSRFGQGALEGVAGPETANNSYCGGALIPLFTLGIPSSPTIAIILGAFMMHGLTPGPALFEQNPVFIWGVVASMFIGNAVLLVMNLPMAGWWARIAMIPPKLLYPLILVISIVGAYTANNSLFDVGTMIVFGILGYLMKKADIPMAPIVLTFVLGKMLESSLLQSLRLLDGSFLNLFLRPIAGPILSLAVLVLVFGMASGLRKRSGGLAADVEM